MQEIENHIAYELLKTKYDRIDLDYVIMSVDTEYEGDTTHKNAIIEALHIINLRNIEYFRSWLTISDFLIIISMKDTL